MTLVDFLLQRIAEDEAVAERASSHNGGATFAKDNYGCLLVQPARVLAECAAKRQIVALHQRYLVALNQESRDADRRCSLEPVVRLLALPYADHPDYREEWRP